MSDVALIGREVKDQYSDEYRKWDEEEVGIAVLASTRLSIPDYRDQDILVLAGAILQRIYENKGFIRTLSSQFSTYLRKKNHTQIYEEIESIKRLLRQRYELEREVDEYAYERSQREPRRIREERIEEAQTEAVIERARRLIPESHAGEVALVRALSEAEARKTLVIEQAKVKAEKELMEARLEDQRKRNILAEEHKMKMDALELERMWKEIAFDLDASTIFSMQHLTNAEQIQLRLRKCYERIQELKGQDTYAAKKERKLLKRYVKKVEKQFYAVTGLFQGEAQENTQGSNPNSQSPGDPR